MTVDRVGALVEGTSLSPEARALLARRSKISPTRIPTVPARDSAAPSPVSSEQQMLWLSAQLDQSNPVFNRCLAVRISGKLDRKVLEQSLNEIVRRHAILRSRIVLRDGTPVIEVVETIATALDAVNLESVAAADRDAHVSKLLEAEIAKPFNLETGPLFRFGLIQESALVNVLFIAKHHIISDRWSDAVLFRELETLYRSFENGEASPLDDLRIQYTDFTAWERGRSQSPEVQANIDFWRMKLTGAPVSQRLPTDRPRPELPDMSAGAVKIEVPADLADALTSIGRKRNATPAVTMLAAFHLLQFRLSGQLDSVVGLSVAGRASAELHEMIGLFSSVLPVRVAIDRDMSFVALLDSVRTAAMEAQVHQETPSDSILEALQANHAVRHPEIAQTIFNFRNMPTYAPALPGLELEPIEVFNGASVADLELEVIEQSPGWECILRFRKNLFDEATAQRILGHYSTLLESIALNPDETAGRLRILTAIERRQILADSYGPARDFRDSHFIDQLFSNQAKKTPSLIAVSSAEGTMTYAELDRSSNALARDLASRNVSAGDFVGVCMDRSLEMVVALMAILKSGAAFVPLDVDYPPERLAHMLSDTSPRLLIADEKGEAILGGRGVNVVRATKEWLAAPEQSPFFADRPDNAVACVLFTSGSTGLPKGVLSTHRGISNNLHAMQATFRLTTDDCMLQQTSLGFDAAAWEVFWPLSVGARTFLARPRGQREADYVVDVIAAERIALVGFAPSMLNMMLGTPAFTGNRNIKHVLSYGEVLSPRLVDGLFARMPGVQVHNLYGPTETSIVITTWNCERDSTRSSIPIGLPVTNCEVYVLDQELEPVPTGVEGEIYIGGICVSNGYHNRPDLTAERFRPHPFRPETDDRVYKTGDIARFGADGAIEYIGRRDHQIKIRGLRIELEEIESALVRLPGIRESVVIVEKDESDEPRLIGYVAVENAARTPSAIARELENSLPPQFIPSQIICLSSMPHSVNGKIDRKQLPAPSSVAQVDLGASEQPANDIEAQVAAIWKDLLSGREFGVTDSFFYVGGHSLLAVRMLQRIADEMSARVSLRAFYHEPTIRATSRLIAGHELESPARDHAAILQIREGAPGSQPLFYLNGQPPGGGKYANELARFLPETQGLSIVPVPLLENPVTVESVATRMTALIRAEQPHGPYLLGGNCFGATLAFEVAQQMTRAGEEVSLLALFHPDARTPMHLGFRAMRRIVLLGGLGEEIHFARFSGAFDFTVKTIRQVIAAQLRSSPKDRFDRLSQSGAWLKEFLAKNAKRPGRTLKALRDRAPREADERIQEEGKKDFQPTPEFNASGDSTAQTEMAAHARYMSDAWTAYNPKRYEGRVAIIWPVEGPANPPWDPRALWNRLTPNLDWHWVSGNHWSMFHEYFDESARTLVAALANLWKEK
jgi:amino acid adenylation domain-containing protein